MSDGPQRDGLALSWVSVQASAMTGFVQRHPLWTLTLLTSIILGASWYLKRIRKRLPAKEIDLYKHQSASRTHLSLSLPFLREPLMPLSYFRCLLMPHMLPSSSVWRFLGGNA